jgi:GNAT superfamily N-acetyltransferase
MITYNVESFFDCIEDIKPLFYDHWLEIAGHQDTIPLDPDYDQYAKLDEMGLMRMMIVRDEGEPIGYFITFTTPAHMHYQTTSYGLNDILYVKPSYRKGTVAYRMMRKAMDDLREQGVNVLVVHMKVKHEFRRLLTALGFNLAEENWEIEL